jgi:hypothetical protein
MPRKTDFSNCYIYHIVDSNKVVHYVGSTSNINSRKSKHKYECYHENRVHYNYNIYKYIRENGGWDSFEIVPIRRIQNISNTTDLRIAEREEMEKFTGLKNMIGSYVSDEERIEKKRIWHENNKERQKENLRKWRENNTEYWKRRREKNPEKIAEIRKKWHENNPGKRAEYCKRWREKKQLEASNQ